MDLNGTSAIVTGGASGLGLATSRLLAERGVRVVVADLQEDKGVPLAKEIGGLFVQTDVTNPGQVIAAVDAAVEMAPLKSLVNCAGIGWATRTIGRDGDYASAHDLDLYRRVIEINLIGTFNCVRLAATKMSLNEPDVDGARGAIVNTASVAAEDGQIGQAAYSSSKGGVVGMTLPVARDLAVVGIRVNTILPGLIDTPIYGEGEGARRSRASWARTCCSRTAWATRPSSRRWRSSCCPTRTSTPSRSASTPASGCSPNSSHACATVRSSRGGTVMIDPELAAIVDVLPKMDLADPVAARQAFEAMLAGITFDIPGIETLDIEDRMVPGHEDDPDVSVRVYRPKGVAAGTVAAPGIVMIHGGGFVIGSVEVEHAGAAQSWRSAPARSWSRSTTAWPPSTPTRPACTTAMPRSRYLHDEADALGVDPGSGGAGRDERRGRAGGGHRPAGPRPGRPGVVLPAAAHP